jgi:hypothetical protein
MERNSTLRFDYASERVAAFVTECARSLFKVICQYQNYPKRVKVTGDTDAREIEYTREEIDGEYYFEIDIEDMAAVSRQQKIKDAYDALVALSPFPEVNKWPLLRDLLDAFGKDSVDEYLMPEQGPPLDPQFENEMMVRGVPVRPNPNEDFDLHLRIHADFMNLPAFQNAIGVLPQIQALFSEHIQLTTRMRERFGQEMTQPGKSASIQRGRAGATSQPVGGPRNTAGPAGNPLMQAMGQLLGR